MTKNISVAQAKEHIKKVQAGQVRTINDAKTRGHKSLITKVNKKGIVSHEPTTHVPKTRGIKNIELMENWDKNDKRKSYVIPKLQKTSLKYVGKIHPDMKNRNAIDKSICRHIKKKK